MSNPWFGRSNWLKSAAQGTLGFLAVCTCYIFFIQRIPSNPNFTFQFDNAYTFFCMPAVFVSACLIMGISISYYRKYSAILSQITLLSFFTMMQLEFFQRHNDNFGATIKKLSAFMTSSYFMPQSFLFALCCYLLLFLLCNSIFAATVSVTAIYCVASLTDSGINKFFGRHLNPYDLVIAVREFNEIGIHFFWYYVNTYWIGLLLMSAVICYSVYKSKAQIRLKPKQRIAGCVFIGFFTVMIFLANKYNFYEKNLEGFNYFHHPSNDYYNNSFLVGFISAYFFSTKTEQPAEYSKEKIDAILKSIKCSTPTAGAVAEKLPFILVWQSESFEDIRKYTPLTVPAEVYAPMDRLLGHSVHGNLLTPQYYTINSQFEFASSLFYKYFMPDMVIYNRVRRKIDFSLGYALKKHGYKTVSLHKYNPSTFNWKVNGDSLYGIDEMCRLQPGYKEFQGTQQVSDMQYAETALACLDKYIKNDVPTALFVQTDQNHPPHETWKVQKPNHIKVLRFGKYDDRLTAYARGLHNTTRTVEWITAALNRYNVPVVLLFYGDHNAYYGDSVKDVAHNQAMSHHLKSNTTSFFIWSNYKDESREVPPLSIALLGNELMRYISQPLNRYQFFLESFKKCSRGLSNEIIIDSEGKEVTTPGPALARAINDQWLLEYDVMLGNNYSNGKLSELCSESAKTN